MRETVDASGPGRGLATWFGWFLGFFLMAIGWAVLTPGNQYPDEQHHVYRAAAVVRGDIVARSGEYMFGTGGVVPVPQSLHAIFSPEACQGFFTHSQCEPTSDPNTVIMVSGEARVYPVYYLIVGLPSLLWPDGNGLLAMRIVSGALSAALLALAATVVLSMPGRRVVLLAAMFAGLTPLAIDLTGSVSPSATEVGSALCFWAAVLALIHGRSTLSRRSLLWVAGVSGVVLVSGRFLGIFFALLAVAVSLLTVDRATQLRFLRTAARPLFVPLFIAGALITAWTVVFRSYIGFRYPADHHITLGEIVRASLGNTGLLLKQTVGYLGQLTVPPPRPTMLAWALIVGLVLLIAVYRAPRRAQVATVVGLALILLVPFAITAESYPTALLGAYQGRYTLPLSVGVGLLAVMSTRTEPVHPRRTVAAAWTVLALCAVGQFDMLRVALPVFNRSTLPPIPTIALTLLLLGTVVLTVRIIRADRGSVGSGSLAAGSVPADSVGSESGEVGSGEVGSVAPAVSGAVPA